MSCVAAGSHGQLYGEPALRNQGLADSLKTRCELAHACPQSGWLCVQAVAMQCLSSVVSRCQTSTNPSLQTKHADRPLHPALTMLQTEPDVLALALDGML